MFNLNNLKKTFKKAWRLKIKNINDLQELDEKLVKTQEQIRDNTKTNNGKT